MKNKIKIAFIHGRPQGHPIHMEYAKSINADNYHVDYKFRYHDISNASSLRRYFSWLICALTFPLKKYDIIFSEEPYFMVGLFKWLKLLKANQKIVALQDTHTLYFLNNNKYAPSTKKASITLLKAYDGFICVGEFQKTLLLKLIGENKSVPIYATFNGVGMCRLKQLLNIVPNLHSYNIVFIGAVPNAGRIWYKGVDLLLGAFNEAKKSLPLLTLTIIGEFDKVQMEALIKNNCADFNSDIFLTGNINNIDDYLRNAGLYVHPSRGEAWGIAINEAMAAGVIPIVSDCTGAMEVVRRVDEKLIAGLCKNDIAEKIKWYYNLHMDEKLQLSALCKKIVSEKYTEENAIECFKKTFGCMLNDLKIGNF